MNNTTYDKSSPLEGQVISKTIPSGAEGQDSHGICTTSFSGRTGNNFYQLATLIAYAHRHGMEYHIPAESPDCPGKKLQFNVDNKLAPFRAGGCDFTEPDTPGHIDIPKMDNVRFRGYWQSFRYFDDYRAEVLAALRMPYRFIQGVVSIHVRRGDFLTLSAFKVLPSTYYKKAIDFFLAKDLNGFYVFSDDIAWCRQHFTAEEYPGAAFVFVDGGTEIGDMSYMSCCEHNIVANSSFSFAAAWLNQNPDKIVLCPPKADMWYNKDMVPDYFIQIEH